MYNNSNFVISLNKGSLINLTIGGTTSLVFNIKNNDSVNTLYNLSFELTLGDGMELVEATIPYTEVEGNIYSFTNIKDLAPLEIDYKFTIVVNLNIITANGNIIPFGTLIPCSFMASADTMPRGQYDNDNEIIQTLSEFSFNASKYTIEKINPPKLLLGKSYISKIIIKTAVNSGINFDKIEDILGNGLNYLGNLVIKGYSLLDLNNVVIISPNETNNSYKLVWINISIPQNITLEIQYEVKVNERYYLNGSQSGAYIENASNIINKLSWIIENLNYSYDYVFVAYEVILEIVVSKYIVDINESVVYSINFYANLYHDLLSVSGYLSATDGQVLADTSTPMYTSKVTAENGVTQIIWNVGNILKGTYTNVIIDGNIASQYISSGLNILAGDNFNVSTICYALSSTTNKVINSADTTSFKIDIPSVSKVITGYYYRDNTPKSFEILAPGDYISYTSSYDSTNVKAPASLVKIYDFYPYITKDIMQINYEYSSQEYPGRNVFQVDPYGVLWFIRQIPGNKIFNIVYKTQLDYVNISSSFPYNLFKLQISNSNEIAYSSRSQVGFLIGKPNLILNKTVVGNNINRIKIGEVYSFAVTLNNNNSNQNITDAFDMTFTETISEYVTLNTNSIIAKINQVTIPSNIQGNKIVVIIPKLAPSDIFTLNYEVTINDTLGPNQSFIFNSSTTAPYSQIYDENQTNFQYDVGALTNNVILKSQNLSLKLSSDTSSKIVGEIVYYTLEITIRSGQKISELNVSILIPQTETYLNEAWINNTLTTPTIINNVITFPTINDINTTNAAIIYSYRIKCLVADSIVSIQNPLYTMESYYGNVSYVDMLNKTVTLGINNFFKVNHPHVDLDIGSASVMNGFTSEYILGSNNIVYTEVKFNNLGSVSANDFQGTITIPIGLNFNSVQIYSNGVNYSYDSQTRVLSMSIDKIDGISNKYLIFKSNILTGNKAESKLILTGEIKSYYNDISNTKKYTSDSIYNNELYLNSIMNFLPLQFYSLVGSNSAISLSKPGDITKIQYILTNLGQGSDSYKIEITPIKYKYDVYIGETFIQTVNENTSASITSSLLNDIEFGQSRYISLSYTIPIESEEPLYGTMLVKASSLNNTNVTKTIPTTLQDP